MTAADQVHGPVAVITLANPPVNGLGLSTRQGLVDGLERANDDAAVTSIVITTGVRPAGGRIRAVKQPAHQTKSGRQRPAMTADR